MLHLTIPVPKDTVFFVRRAALPLMKRTCDCFIDSDTNADHLYANVHIIADTKREAYAVTCHLTRCLTDYRPRQDRAPFVRHQRYGPPQHSAAPALRIHPSDDEDNEGSETEHHANHR